MEKLRAFIKKYYEGLAYLFFGGLATLLNLVLFAVFQAVLGTGFATGIGNVLDNIICILFAYVLKYFKCTNLISIKLAKIHIIFNKVCYIKMSPRYICILFSSLLNCFFANINTNILFLLKLVSV